MTEKRRECLSGKVSVLHSRGGVGRTETPCHPLSSLHSLSHPTDLKVFPLSRFYQLIPSAVSVPFWLTCYESWFPPGHINADVQSVPCAAPPAAAHAIKICACAGENGSQLRGRVGLC